MYDAFDRTSGDAASLLNTKHGKADADPVAGAPVGGPSPVPGLDPDDRRVQACDDHHLLLFDLQIRHRVDKTSGQIRQLATSAMSGNGSAAAPESHCRWIRNAR
jgi:hypothetical protein